MLSALSFRKREDIKRRYRFYQRSPSTPLYKRCQLIKKKLVFSEDDVDGDTEASTIQKAIKTEHKIDNNLINIPFIPTIVLTSPNTKVYCPHEPRVFRKTPYQSLPKTSKQILKTGEEYSSRNCKMATPNTMFILQNLSPLGKHKVLGRGRFGCVIESCYKSKSLLFNKLSSTFYFVLLRKTERRTGMGHGKDGEGTRWDGEGAEKIRERDRKGTGKGGKGTGKEREPTEGWTGKGRKRENRKRTEK